MSGLLSTITAPISEAAPFGANINHDLEFATLKAEIGKFGNLDLSLIEKTAVEIIERKAKDVRVLSFLAYCCLRKENWEGFADVFDGLAKLAEKNYEALQPDRERAKELAFRWLSEERFRASLAERQPSETDYDHVARLLGALESLKFLLERKFEQNPPFPFELFKRVQSWEQSCKPKPVAAAPAPLAGGPASVAAAGASELERMETPKQAQAGVRKAALFLIEKDPQKVMGYRLMRCLRWDILEKAPPAEAGKTALPGPPQQQRLYFQNLLAQQEWKTAIEKAEAAFASASNHVWLDLQRIIVRSCERLGEPYAPLRDAVLFETVRLIRRIPDITTLSFSDGAPFCDGETRQWLAAKAQPGSAVGIAAMPATSSDDRIGDALALASAGRIEEAIDIVQGSERSSKSERESFRRSILIAELLLGAKQTDIAVSLLEMLDRKAEAFSLDRWDPDLAMEAWTALVRAYGAAKIGKQQPAQSTLREKQNSILTKITCIDPKKALTLAV